MDGFQKIQKSCESAVKDGYRYVWVDTCCINNDSSAELSQVTNSMYRWYQASAVCYIFLGDVQANPMDGEAEAESIRKGDGLVAVGFYKNSSLLSMSDSAMNNGDI